MRAIVSCSFSCFLVVLTAILAPFLTILHSSSSREMQRTMLPSNTSEQTDCDGDDESVEKEISETKCQKMLMRVTTRNFLAMQTEVVFDPDTDVIHNPKTYRPFCNFLVKDKPYFIHPELLHDDDLRIKLLGKEKGTLMEESSKDDGKKKDPDDDFL